MTTDTENVKTVCCARCHCYHGYMGQVGCYCTCNKAQRNDSVDHPVHYTSGPAVCSACKKTIETIDVTRHLSFTIGNAIKYLWRYKLKNGKEDLRKAIWYINDEIENGK